MMTGMSEQPGYQPPVIDWQKTPYLNAVFVLATLSTGFGVFGTIIGLSTNVLFGTSLLIAGSVLLGVGVTGWMVYASVMFWRHESRNQMLTLVAAMTGPEDRQPEDPRWRRF